MRFSPIDTWGMPMISRYNLVRLIFKAFVNFRNRVMIIEDVRNKRANWELSLKMLTRPLRYNKIVHAWWDCLFLIGVQRISMQIVLS